MWCLWEKLVWPPTRISAYSALTLLPVPGRSSRVQSVGRWGGWWGGCFRMAHMLKDLVDYFKLEEINIDNWTFKLYYKVFRLQMWSYVLYLVYVKRIRICFDSDISLIWDQKNCLNHQFSKWQINDGLRQYLSDMSNVSNYVSEWVLGPRAATMSWINNRFYCIADRKSWHWIWEGTRILITDFSGLCGDLHGRSNNWNCQPVFWRSHQVIRNVHGEEVGWRRIGQFGLLRFALPTRGWDADVLHLPCPACTL